MAEKDATETSDTETGATPSLELPKLFGRRKKRAPEPPLAPVESESVDPPSMQATQVIEPPPVQEEVVEPPPMQEPAAVEPTPAQEPEAVEPPPMQEPAAVEPPPAQEPEVVEPEAPPVAEPETEPTVAIQPVEIEVVADAATGTGATAVEPDDIEEEADVQPRRSSRERLQSRLPSVAATTAAIAVGAVVGLLGCVLTYAGLKACELVTSTDSCGGPGLLLLLVIVVAMILVGAAMLRLFTVPDALNLSFLGVGITVAVVLIFLADKLFEPYMFIVMPVLTALAYGAARWVTTLYVDDVMGDDDGELHDIR